MLAHCGDLMVFFFTRTKPSLMSTCALSAESQFTFLLKSKCLLRKKVCGRAALLPCTDIFISPYLVFSLTVDFISHCVWPRVPLIPPAAHLSSSCHLSVSPPSGVSLLMQTERVRRSEEEEAEKDERREERAAAVRAAEHGAQHGDPGAVSSIRVERQRFGGGCLPDSGAAASRLGRPNGE